MTDPDARASLLLAGEVIYGSSFNDSLRGDNNANTIWGAVGNDAVCGRDRNDVLYAVTCGSLGGHRDRD